MIITYWKGVFVADTHDRIPLEKAGFELHEPSLCEESHKCKACKSKIGRRYFTNRVEDATRLKQYCNERALLVMKRHLDSLAKSRAIDAKINIPSPPGFEYKPFQKAGIAYALQHKDTLIGDEPGLGKTIQAIGFINYTKPKNVLIVVPATLIYNWLEELRKWLVVPYVMWTPKNTKDEAPPYTENLIVITNYEKITGRISNKVAVDTKFSASIKRIWDLSIYDEAHALKNPKGKKSEAVLGETGFMRRSKRCLFLTGTPIENYPKEIWPIASAICPAKFGDWESFARRYCGLHLEKRNGYNAWVATGATHLAELQQKLRTTFMVRRLKYDVLKELPPKIRQLVILSDEKIDWTKHPSLVKWKMVYEQKYEIALAKIEAVKTNAEYIKAVRELDALTGVDFKEMSEFRHQTAVAKLPMCLSYIDELLPSVESLIIFAHHEDVLQKAAEHFGDQAVLLYGETPMADRGKIINAFQRGDKRIIIGGLKAAGIGTTLTRANTVIFIEIDWNPATLSQAEDRACRIGQTKVVHVIHLALNHTLDVNMSQRVIAKQKAIDKALDHLPEIQRLKQLQLPTL